MGSRPGKGKRGLACRFPILERAGPVTHAVVIERAFERRLEVGHGCRRFGGDGRGRR